jgi:hypothetical protein
VNSGDQRHTHTLRQSVFAAAARPLQPRRRNKTGPRNCAMTPLTIPYPRANIFLSPTVGWRRSPTVEESGSRSRLVVPVGGIVITVQRPST